MVIVGLPGDPVDTVILPGGAGVDAARSEPALIDWVKAVSGTARRVVTVCTGAFLAAEAGLLGRTPSDDALGLCRTFRPRISGRSGRCRPDLHAQFAEGVDRGWSHRRHRPRAGTGRRRPRHRDCPDGCPLARPVSAPTRWADPVRGSGVDATRQTDLDPPGAGGHRGRAGGAHRIGELAQRAAMSPRHFTRVFSDEVGEAPGRYVERIRTEAARRQLEETHDTVVAIAARCGFGTAETMRRSFIRRVGISPDQYRKAFA
ncbi:HTH-type transcriptional regulator [Mycobacterium tuberculosis]|uniref:HTH-type transcriptional regulator n=1 Tax=Mycobacterium tuberculosis TaxID=1773 RepID=UPI0003C7EEBD|nr:HTH-type transcriptional regulator [Mycobacterium tuberculosis]